jgi:Xaa-Pro aminopeptidase
LPKEANLHITPLAELVARKERLQGLLQDKKIDGAIILQRADLFYFSGTGQDAHLLVPATGEPLLLVRKSFDRARRESHLPVIEHFPGKKGVREVIRSNFRQIQKIGMELDVVPANQYLRFCAMFPETEIVDVSPLIRDIRMIKSEYEIGKLREAAVMSDRMFATVHEVLELGITECTVAGRLEGYYRSLGHQGYVRVRSFNQEVFYGHLMSGANLTTPSFPFAATGGSGLNPSFPQGAGTKIIAANEPIMVDLAGVYDGYIADQTRIFVFGQLPEQLVAAFDTALSIEQYLKEKATPGALCSDLFAATEHIAAKAGLGNHYMGYGPRARFVGHGVGIELDEWPVIAKGIDTPLHEGMVVAIEPKFLFPDIGVVGLENTWVVQSDGLEALTTFPNEITYLKKVMKA